jgi:hypothetical protein
VQIDVVTDGGDHLFEILEDSAADLVCGQIAKEALDHIEPGGGGGREAHVETPVAGKLALHAWMLVGRVVVADEVDLFLFLYRFVDHTQEAQPFLMAMPLLAEPIDFTSRGIEGGEQGGCAIALVIVRHSCATALLQRQTGLCVVQGLNLALLVDGKDQRVFRRFQIQPDDGLQLLSKVRIVADLEAFDAMRLQSMRAPDAAHAGLGDANFAGHRAARPMRGSGRLRLRCLGDHLGSELGRDTRCSSRSRRVFHQPLDTQFAKPLSPKRCHAWRNPQPLRNLLVLHPFGGQQNNASSLRHANRRSAPRNSFSNASCALELNSIAAATRISGHLINELTRHQ